LHDSSTGVGIIIIVTTVLLEQGVNSKTGAGEQEN
jgi:hypothetical protein